MLLPAALVTLVLMARAFILGAVRVSRLSEFAHRSAAWIATAMLVLSGLLYFDGLALMCSAWIPRMMELSSAGNETAAIYSLKAIAEAEVEYQSTYPDHGFACQLSQLGGDPAMGAPSADAAQLFMPDLAAGIKVGYRFTLSCKWLDISQFAREIQILRPRYQGDVSQLSDDPSGAVQSGLPPGQMRASTLQVGGNAVDIILVQFENMQARPKLLIHQKLLAAYRNSGRTTSLCAGQRAEDAERGFRYRA